jgi:hypothetical protein
MKFTSLSSYRKVTIHSVLFFVFGVEVKYQWLFDKTCRFQTAETVPKDGERCMKFTHFQENICPLVLPNPLTLGSFPCITNDYVIFSYVLLL